MVDGLGCGLWQWAVAQQQQQKSYLWEVCFFRGAEQVLYTNFIKADKTPGGSGLATRRKRTKGGRAGETCHFVMSCQWQVGTL